MTRRTLRSAPRLSRMCAIAGHGPGPSTGNNAADPGPHCARPSRQAEFRRFVRNTLFFFVARGAGQQPRPDAPAVHFQTAVQEQLGASRLEPKRDESRPPVLVVDAIERHAEISNVRLALVSNTGSVIRNECEKLCVRRAQRAISLAPALRCSSFHLSG